VDVQAGVFDHADVKRYGLSKNRKDDSPSVRIHVNLSPAGVSGCKLVMLIKWLLLYIGVVRQKLPPLVSSNAL
jgi:hypothetical protein